MLTFHESSKAGWADESRSAAARDEGSGEMEVVTSTRAEPTVEESVSGERERGVHLREGVFLALFQIFLDKLLSVTESPPTTTN